MRDIIVITPESGDRNKFDADTPEAGLFRDLRLGDMSDLEGFEGQVVNIQEDYEATLITLS